MKRRTKTYERDFARLLYIAGIDESKHDAIISIATTIYSNSWEFAELIKEKDDARRLACLEIQHPEALQD